jgi:hypothetical protein
MSAIVVAGDTSGSITLQAPAVAGSGTVLTLPTTTGTLVSSGAIPAAGSSTQIQYNSGGSFAGSANMTYSTSGGMTVNGVTQGYNTTLYTVDGALSNYSSSNAVYLNGNRAGWLDLQADGTQNTYIQLFGSSYSTPNIIGFYTGSAERMRITSAGLVQISASSTNNTFTSSGELAIKNSGSNPFISFHNNTGTRMGYIQGNNGPIVIQSELSYLSLGDSTGEVARCTGGNFQFSSGYGSVATAYGCRAWVSYNGNTQTIRGSGGISSVTFRANGRYTLNFSFTMPDTNYSVMGMVSNDSTATSFIGAIQDTTNAAPSTTACPVMTGYATGSGMVDAALYRATNYAFFAVFR